VRRYRGVTTAVVGAALLLGAVHESAAAATRPMAPVVDITAESGGRVVGRVVSWQAPGRVERLAGRSAGGHLLVFSWSSAVGRWRVENVSSATGQIISGPPVAWLMRVGRSNVEHVAAPAPGGRLLVFERSTGTRRWRVVDVTARTGRGVVEVSASRVTRRGLIPVGHVAGRDDVGRLLVFSRGPFGSWQVVDVSALTGRRIASSVTAWELRRGATLHEYFAATGTDGRVAIFAWSPRTGWRAQTLPERLPDGVTAWTTGGVEHLAGASADGTLVVRWRHGTGTWRRVDVTAITQERVDGPPTVYQLRDGRENVEVLGSRGRTGDLIVHWWKPSRDWQALNLTELTGVRVASRPEGWLTTSGTRVVEHLAAVAPDGRLRVFYSFDQPRTLTDRVGAPYQSIRRMRNVTRKVLVVLWDPRFPNVTSRASRQEVVGTVFGPGASVRRYFLENSGGAFTITTAGVLGWYDAEHPLSYYDNPARPRDKMGAALRAADPHFNFRAHDANGSGVLEPHELAIVFAHPGGPGGLVRSGSRQIRDPDTGGDLVLDGVMIREGVELGIGNPPNLGIVAHELSHILLGLPDMYFTFFTPTAAGAYSLMDNTYSPFHLDPFNKLKLGWAQPRLVLRSRRYALPDIETRNRVLVLLDPRRGTDEYFLVENRWPGTSFDAGLPSRGLGIWHIMERPEVYNAAPPPPTVSLEDWNQLGPRAWDRKAIRMIRPVVTRPFDDRKALWVGGNPELGYDLLPMNPDPLRASLRWGDGTPSAFALRSIGAPGPEVSVTINVP
jgi:M6 family metalloprotease-like protein